MNGTIIFIDETSKMGGGEVNLIFLVRYLIQQQIGVEVILPEEGTLSERLRLEGIPVKLIPGVPEISLSFVLFEKYKIPNPFAILINLCRGLLWTWRLASYLRFSNPIAVQTVSLWAHIFGGIAGRIAGRRVIAHFQNIVLPGSGFGTFRTALYVWARVFPERIVCVSDLVAEQFRTMAGVSEKTMVIWNCINTSLYQTPERNSSVDELRFGTIARITPWKGQHVALKTAKILREQGVLFKWFFTGDTALGSEAYYQRLMTFVRDWNLKDYVEFLGWRDDIPQMYREFDIFIHLPIESEPFGLVIAEAMAAGLPIVTTAGGATALVTRAECGFVVPFDDPVSTAKAVAQLASDPAMRKSMGEKGKTFAAFRFSPQVYVSEWMKIYGRTASHARSS